jgi:hypothetical protein
LTRQIYKKSRKWFCTLMQLLTPANMRGRVAAVNGMFIGSSAEIGNFESGLAAKLPGTVPSVLFGSSMTLHIVVFTWFKTKKLPGPSGDDIFLKGEEKEAVAA